MKFNLYSLIILTSLISCSRLPYKEKVQSPESCHYFQEHFYFSNFDNENAYISRIKDYKIERIVTKGLNKPKGLSSYKELLVVTDINTIKIINPKTKRVEKSILIPDAIFLNDVFVTDSGIFYVSDSKTQKIHAGHIDSSKTKTLLKTSFVPNGLHKDGEKLLIASWGNEMDKSWNTKQRGMLWVYNLKTKNLGPLHNKRIGYLDGVVKLGDDYLVSAKREGELYLVNAKDVSLYANALGPADIDHNGKILCIPSFTDHQIELREL